MYPFQLLSLVLALVWVTRTDSIIVSKFAAKSRGHGHSNAVSCASLPNVIDKLLAAGMVSDGAPLMSSNLYSVHYPAGSNPSSADLYATIPKDAFGPTDDKAGATKSSKGWDRIEVSADDRYGEQSADVYSEDGGLPSFCRFGGQIQTSSSGSRAHFEVWMPLPDHDSESDDELRITFQDAVAAQSGANSATQLRLDANVVKTSFATASTSGWSKRLLFIVGGALRGTVAYPELKQALARYRVAVAGTNMGHFSAATGTKWLPDNQEGWTDFGHRAVHLTTMASQLTVKTFYGTEKLLDQTDSRHRGPRTHSGFFSYFKGCSTGGRAGMAEAQRYPKDFDGILAGCPAFDYNNLGAYQIHVNSYQSDNTSSSYIPTQDYALVNKAVLDSCDAQDGVRDNVISLPYDCKPDFAKRIGCSALGIQPIATSRSMDETFLNVVKRSDEDVDDSVSESPLASAPGDAAGNRVSAIIGDGSSSDDDTNDDDGTDAAPDHTSPSNSNDDADDDDDKIPKRKKPLARCLTDAQIDNLKNIYSDYYINGKFVRQAVLPGSEFGWTVTKGVTGKTFTAATGWFQYEVLGQKTWKKEFDPYVEVTPDVIARGQSKDPGGTINFDPDLSAFFSNGGKLLHYHGLADQLVTSGVSPQYYDMVKAKFGEQDLSDKYRLFLIPGMLHCRGGTGPFNYGGAGQAKAAGLRPLQYDAQHDMFLSLIEWVEKGKAPDFIIGAAYKTQDGTGPATSKQKTSYANGVLNTRLLCPYPAQARLKTSGTKCSTAEACAFECS